MKPLKKVAVIGGDERCRVCADLFAGSGSECAVFGMEKSSQSCFATKCMTLSDALGGCDVLLLPLPVMQDSTFINTPLSNERIALSDIISLIDDNTVIFAGNPGKCFFAALHAAGAKNEVINYTEIPAFSILGCVPTAEGAAAEVSKMTGKTVSGSVILVTGCGRVGKHLARLLKAMDAAVFVSARKSEDLAWIEANGMHPLRTDQLRDCNVSFDLICNTVPALIFDEKTLSSLKGSPAIMELASKPYGAGFKCRQKSVTLSLHGETKPAAKSFFMLFTAGNFIS